jgi:flagellum-specific ATP synthase
MLNIYRQNKDLIELGAYQPGNNKELDHIVTRIDTLNQILTQSINQSNPIIQVNQSLREIIK